LTTEVEDKKPEDCKGSGACQKMATLLKEDMPPSQLRQSVLELCAKCDEFERRREKRDENHSY